MFLKIPSRISQRTDGLVLMQHGGAGGEVNLYFESVMQELLKLRLRSFTVLGRYTLGCLIGTSDIMIYFWYSILLKTSLISFFLSGHGQTSDFSGLSLFS